MAQPINYLLDVQDPMTAALKGYQVGAAFKDKRIKQQQALQMQQDLAELSSNPNASSEDFSKMMVKYPELSDHFKKSWDVLNEGQKEQRLGQLSQVYSALETENPEIAISLLEDQKQAATNSGLMDEAKKAETMQEMIKMKPEAAKTMSRMALSTVLGPDKFASTFETLTRSRGEKIGTYKFNDKVGMINTTTGELVTSIKDLGLPTSNPEKKFDQEDKLRKDFNGITKDFRSVRDSISRVRSSAEEPSAAGDLALIFNYMKILDPGSTVREGEFANAQNSAGVPDIIRAQYNRIASGKRLSDTQRKDFVGRANKLFDKRQMQYKKTSKEYEKLSKRYGLSPENIVLDLDIVEDVKNEGVEPSQPSTTQPVQGAELEVTDEQINAVLNKYRD